MNYELREQREIQELQELGARRRWQFNTIENVREPRIMASRSFSYACGASALLSASHTLDDRRQPTERVRTPLHPLQPWEGSLFLPFSEGSQSGLNDRRFAPIRDWALATEQVLQVPLELERVQTVEGVERIERTLQRQNAWWMMCLVFDLDFYALSSSRIMAELVKKQAPDMAGAR